MIPYSMNDSPVRSFRIGTVLLALLAAAISCLATDLTEQYEPYSSLRREKLIGLFSFDGENYSIAPFGASGSDATPG